ncbi:MAG: hypothetical protein GXP49_07430 [Deltaproteobacteria bacterium]|nr:hypothetical protein [Deltaproteobacteria bacterium]
MKRPTEQDLARHFLAHRNTGYSIAYVLRQSKGRYALHIGILIAFLVGFQATDDLWLKGFCLWAIGMFFGALVRDAGWLRRIKMSWPFTQKITNWRKVEAIAEGRDSADQAVDGTA